MTLEEMQGAGYKLTKTEAEGLYNTVIKDYKSSLIKMKEEVDTVYSKYLSGKNPDEYYFIMSKYSRFKTFDNNMKSFYTNLSKETEKLMEEISRLSFTNNYYRQQYTLQHFADSNIFSLVNPFVVQISVLGTDDVWKEMTETAVKKFEETYGSLKSYQPRHGTLIETLTKNKTKTLSDIKSSITQGLIQGKSSKEVGKDISKIMNTSVNNSNRIAQTEMMRNMNAGDYAEYNVAKSKGMKLQRQIVSVLDNRTRQQSAEVDGRIANKDGFLYPNGNRYQYPGNTGVAAFDCNDRESVINMPKGIELDQRSARNPVTGKTEIISYVRFNEWADNNGLGYNKSGKLVKM